MLLKSSKIGEEWLKKTYINLTIFFSLHKSPNKWIKSDVNPESENLE